jgi:hypothetical protein
LIFRPSVVRPEEPWQAVVPSARTGASASRSPLRTRTERRGRSTSRAERKQRPRPRWRRPASESAAVSQSGMRLAKWRTTSVRVSDRAESTKDLYAGLTVGHVEPVIGHLALGQVKPSVPHGPVGGRGKGCGAVHWTLGWVALGARADARPVKSVFSGTFSVISLNTFCRPGGGGDCRRRQEIAGDMAVRYQAETVLSLRKSSGAFRGFTPVVERPRVNSSKISCLRTSTPALARPYSGSHCDSRLTSGVPLVAQDQDDN